jgi:nucleotide sugar dehydrogenase
MKACVVGLGKIGLPLAAQIASKGHPVIGADIAPGVVDAVREGRPLFPGEPGLADRLQAARASGLLDATTDTAKAAADADVVLIVVPLAVDASGRPDFGALDAAAGAVGDGVRGGTLVSVETTVPVGVTRGRVARALAASSGLRLGEDLFVCASPERVSSGRVFADLATYPKLVGAIDAASAARAVAFYSAVLDAEVRDLGSAETAELTKLAETTYRDVNIGLANELAVYADRIGVDVATVIAAANSQPYSHLHTPGIAVGGHCIPVYPRLYLSGDPGARIPAAARLANEAMPAYAVGRLAAHLGGLAGLRVAVLGAAYRGGVKETACSGVFPVVEALEAAGAATRVHDPLYRDDELRALGLDPFRLGEPADAAIVQADHAQYRTLAPDDLPGVRAILDGRGITDPGRWAGVGYLRLGAP